MATHLERTNVPLAIIGMACRLPGANNLDEFWRMLIEGRCAVAELAPDFFDWGLYYDPRQGVRGKTYSRLAAILSDKHFDRQACPVPEELVQSADLCHLLMCETAAKACRHAGLDPFNLPSRNAGVFIGHAQGSSLAGEQTYATCVEEAAQFLREVDALRNLPQQAQDAVVDELIGKVRAKLPGRPEDLGRDLSMGMVAGVTAKAFGLTGPFVAVNSACASSLQAMLLAARALQLGRIDMAIVGGCSDFKGDNLILFAQAQAMSATGTRPFDDNADGLILSEGYAAVVVKTLQRALADGDPIQAVIRGLGVASDGRGKSLWAPRKEGQMEAMRQAYRGDVEMSDLQYIEAHATATQLGDATEVGAVAEVLKKCLPPGRKIPISSLKANVGHLLETAGLAGLIKTVLSIQKRTFPPAANLRKLNTKIAWDTIPVYVPVSPTPWPDPPAGKPRRAGVNAFGIGGLNMHVVIDEFTESARHLLAVPSSASPSKPAARHGDDDAVAIIGMGCVLPGARNVAAYWELLASGRDPKCPAPSGRWRPDLACKPGPHQRFHSPTSLGGYVTDFQYDWRARKLPPKQVAQADLLQFMLLDAADQALQDAGLDKRSFDRVRTGVVVGTEFSGDFSYQLQMGMRLPEMNQLLAPILARQGVSPGDVPQIQAKFTEALLAHWPALVDESGSFSTSSLASRISKTWDLMGGAAAIDSGGTSSLAALESCVNMLLCGDCDLMVCAGGQRRMSLPAYEDLSRFGRLSPEANPRAPFDARANGFVPGEGVGVLLLKRLSDARRDGDPIRGIIRGIAAAHDPAWGDALYLAMRRSLELAGVSPADIALLEADGLGLPEIDEAEARAILRIFGPASRRQPLLLGSVVGQIGNTLGASGMASIIKAGLEVEHGEATAIVGLQTPVAAIAQAPAIIQAALARSPIAHSTEDGRRLAGVGACDRGLAYCVVLERGSKVPVAEKAPASATQSSASPAAVSPLPALSAVSPHPAASWRICRIGAASSEDLLARIAQGDCKALFANAQTARFAPADRVRLAVVADSPDMLAEKLQTASKQISNLASRPILEQHGIFCRTLGEQRPRIAFVFPGQGSQYAGMLRELVRDVPAAADALREIEQALSRHGFPSFVQMAWDDPSRLGVDVWTTQATVLAADRILLAAITARGIRPNLVLGHSYGEFVALAASGACDFEQALMITRARCQSIDACATARGSMLATTAPPEAIQELAAGLPGPIYLANHNAPDQTVIGGSREAVEQFATVLRGKSYQAQVLAVPSPFHTPIMQGAAAAFAQALAAVQFQRPRTPMLSVVTNAYVTEPDAIRANLVAHLTTPVHYVDLIRHVAAEQPTVFVEVGPQQALTRLHRRILERDEVMAIASDNPKRSGTEQLYHVQALLECSGALDPEAPMVAPPTISPAIAASGATPASPTPPAPGEILHFDATARRREKMRLAAAAPARAPQAPAATPHPAPVKPAAKPAAAPPEAAMPTQPPPAAIAPLPEKASATPTKPVPADLEKFLIDFVVEQTGYPPEVVELDADLEADLGIDSIKKAQLFGEMREYFDVTPSANLTLDDFPTLRHVLNYLQGVPQKSTEPSAAASAPAQEVPIVSEKSSPPPAPFNESAGPEIAAAPAVASVPAVPCKHDASALSGANAADLEKFLINFVVEQTGYPPEVVELDADLEADLGIDSIKKAQLFGEMREYFDVTPSANLTLDDFPTLRHVLKYLQGVPQKSTEPSPAASTPVQEIPVVSEKLPAPSAPSIEMVAPESPAVPAVACARDAAAASLANAEDLEKFLINFVVEQTGYPPEVVELDADLEADLGIDSIKKAQLFGEMREYFDVTPSANLTLDDFPTLRHVLNYLQSVPQKSGEPSPAASAPVEAVPVAWEELPTPLAPASELATHESPVVAAIASVPVLPVAPAVACAQDAAAASLANAEDLEKFLINFVVEQTGYPPEVVELDADLEADLGIDSIKKAQLFGEMREYFDVTPSANLTLDDFPTLRHVLNYLQGAPQKASSAIVAPAREEVAAAPPPAAVPLAAAQTPTAVLPQAEDLGSALELEVIRLCGTPYEMGLQQGRQEKEKIRRILRRYVDLVLPETEDLPGSTAAGFDPGMAFDPDQLDELQGIADAVEVPLANIVSHNRAIFSALGSEGLQFAIPASRNAAGGMIHGMAEHLPFASAVRECLVPLVQVRCPSRGIPFATLSFAGAVGGLGGINARGVTVTGSVPGGKNGCAGRLPVSAVRTILEGAADADAAVEIARTLSHSRPWAACISHGPTDRVWHVRYDGHSFEARPQDNGVPCCPGLPQRNNGDGIESLDSLLAASSSRGLSVAEVRRVLTRVVPASVAARLPGAAPDQAILVIDPKEGDVWFGLGSATGEGPAGFRRFRTAELLPPVAPQVARPQGPGPMYDLDDSAESESLTHRFVLRMIDAPLAPSAPPTPSWQGPVLVVGSNAAAAALAGRLKAAGAELRELSISDDLDATVAEFERLWRQGPIPHLFLMSARDELPGDLSDENAWRQRRHGSVIAPYFLCQRWVQLASEAGLLDKCSLVAATALGGDFGFSGKVSAPEGGALCGLVKALFMEFVAVGSHKGLVLKAIDAPDREPPDALAANIVGELAAAAPGNEVAFVGGVRRVPETVPEAAPVEPVAEIRPGATWVVTGGARGITAACALEFGRRFGLKLHLVGTSPLPHIDPAWRDLSEEGMKALKASIMVEARQSGQSPPQAWERVRKAIEIDGSLRAYSAAGVQVVYHSCDVSDRDALAKVLDAVRHADGPIEGILHGAGVECACRFENKNRDSVLATLAAKVEGARNLMLLTCRDPVRFFIGFSSMSGRVGGYGQTDYSLANDMLSKLVGWYRGRRPGCHAVAMQWTLWDGIGMGARPETKAILKLVDAPAYMPKHEGIQHLVRELYAAAPHSEVVIADWDCYHRFCGGRPKDLPPQATPAVAWPLIERVHAEADGGLVAEMRFNPTVDPFLVGHRLRDKPILPNVIGVEAIAEAASRWAGGREVVALRDVENVNGLLFHGEEPLLTKVTVTPVEGGAACSLTSELRDRKGRLLDPARLHVKGIVELGKRSAIAAEPPGEPPQGWMPVRYAEKGVIYHGQPLRCLKAYSHGGDGAWAKIVAPPLSELAGGRPTEGWIVPSAALDACLYACGMYVFLQFGQIDVAHGFDRLRLGHLPRAGETCIARLYFKRQLDRHSWFDFTLFGDDNRVIVEAEGFRSVNVIPAGS